MDLKRREKETYDEYASRLYRYKTELKLSNNEIAKIIKKEFDIDKDESAIRKDIRSYNRGYDAAMTKLYSSDRKPRLVISDLHLPFAIDGWLDFIKETHAKYNCHEEIIINGDLVDLHQFSFHTSEPDAISGLDELELAKIQIAKLVKEFPNAIFLEGNHDLILIRKVKEIGIDRRLMKTFHEILGLPDTWKVMEDAIIDNVYYRHIGSCGGKTGAIMSAVSNRMSTVASHLHADGGVQYATSPNGEMIFGLNTGALVDDKSYALRYGKNSRFKATLGCGLVYDDKEAQFIPYRRDNGKQ